MEPHVNMTHQMSEQNRNAFLSLVVLNKLFSAWNVQTQLKYIVICPLRRAFLSYALNFCFHNYTIIKKLKSRTLQTAVARFIASSRSLIPFGGSPMLEILIENYKNDVSISSGYCLNYRNEQFDSSYPEILVSVQAANNCMKVSKKKGSEIRFVIIDPFKQIQSWVILRLLSQTNLFESYWWLYSPSAKRYVFTYSNPAQTLANRGVWGWRPPEREAQGACNPETLYDGDVEGLANK